MVRQYHYQTLELNEQRLAPYQILCRAKAAGYGLYSMPSSWLDMQPHLLSQGETDPHAFIGRDDRPESMRSLNPMRAELDSFHEVSHEYHTSSLWAYSSTETSFHPER